MKHGKREIRDAIAKAREANQARPQHAKISTKPKRWRKRAKAMGYL